MAKKKRKGDNVAMPASSGEHMSTSIDSAENGFIVNVSGDKGGKNPGYFSKRFIASSRPQAMQIASSHFAGAMKAKGAKKGGRKKTTKR